MEHKSVVDIAMRLHLKMILTCHYLQLEGFSCYFLTIDKDESCLNESLSLAKTHIPLLMANVR